MSEAVPIVDFEDYGLLVEHPQSVKSSSLEKTAKYIYDAFSSTGICYIINHGIPQSSIDQIFSASKAFFCLPVEDKQKCAKSKAEVSQFGWNALEIECVNPERGVADLKESFDFQPTAHGTWPDSLPEFKSSIASFYNECKQLTERVLDILSIGLKLEDRSFLNKCHRIIGEGPNCTTLRSLYYPPLTGDRSVKPGQIRNGEHSDFGTVTLLFQDDIGGLEVQNTEGVYVPAPPVPGAVVVNIGDLMQRWTADQLIATKHRVVIPEEELKKKQSRQSFAFFIHPDDDVIIKCLDGSDKYEPISSLDYLNYRFSFIY